MNPFMVLGQLGAYQGLLWGLVGLVIVVIGLLSIAAQFYKKVEQGEAIIRNGIGGTKTSFSGMFVFPVIHFWERMEISVKRIEIFRQGEQGLICKDNIRADIKVAFFVRVNKTAGDVSLVAQTLGTKRASQESSLVELFDAKFSEALKTVGKQFDFVELYNSRERFKEEILKVIGTDLNGYRLDDAAIDYLEQTPLEKLNQDNILDAEGIKKITDLTSREQIQSNHIRREKEKTITKQNVEAREAILELQRQQAQAEEKQAREIAEIQARERAQGEVVGHQENQRSEVARIAAEEEILIAEENKQRQVIVAEKSKQRTSAVETERVEKDRLLEVTERERVVTLADIEKDKAVEVEKKHIQDVIRERVIVERAVVEEEEKIKDTREFASADRAKRVAVTDAEQQAEQDLVKQVRAAEAEKQAATKQAETIVIQADAERSAAEKETDAKKMLAEATQAEAAAVGLAEAQVTTSKADAYQKHGSAEATVAQRKAEAEARGDEARAQAVQKLGLAEADVLQKKSVAEAKGKEALAIALEKEGAAEAAVLEKKFSADAKGITDKAEAMKLFDGVGREHEEFKLRLNKEKDVELAAIHVQKDIAVEQSRLVGAALQTANIDIVGGETKFFDSIVGSITSGKQVDRWVGNSQVLQDVKNTFFDGDADQFSSELQKFVNHFGMSSEDVKNLSVSALIGQLMGKTEDASILDQLQGLAGAAKQLGVEGQKAVSLGWSKSGGSNPKDAG
ncbi:MAG: flotillin family protein [Planctomycetota bacterium]|nr:flotillin family protein [Planctomycetota bacterium]MEC8571334.1 flotillin family protein [Planctomycetota bacterium]MEC8801425.1 flotillin family protein [Planctomycetota bacterium]